MSRRPGYWWRRAAGYVLGTIVPWSLLTQLLGTVGFGRSAPDGAAGQLTSAVSFVVVAALTALFSRDGQSWAHRLVRLRVRTISGSSPSRSRMGLRAVAHVVDFATLGLGFLWPLWDQRGQTFADKLAGTVVELAE